MSAAADGYGTCVVRTSHAAHGSNVTRVCVSRADPLIRISDALLDLPQDMFPPLVEYGEGWFVIHSHHGPVRYRLLERDEGAGAWVAERRDRTRLCDDLEEATA